MTKELNRYWIIGLVFLGFVPLVIADDGSGCNSDAWYGYGQICYDKKIYQQNQILLQQQNQTNHLIAMQICEKNYFAVQYPDDNSVNGKDFTECVNHLLEVSR